MYIVLEKDADYDGWPVWGNSSDVYYGPFEDREAAFQWSLHRPSGKHQTTFEITSPNATS